MKTKYTTEFKKNILNMWNAYRTSEEIAKSVGLNRNQVIGILRKMREKGLNVRSEYMVGRNPYKMPRAKGNRRIPPKIIIDEPLPDFKSVNYVTKSKERWVPLLHLNDNTCRYTKDGKLFCNAPCEGSYCNDHPVRGGIFTGVNLKYTLIR